MSLHYRHNGPLLILFGNTYPHRDRIKELGGRFNGSEKTWQVPFSAAAEQLVLALCSSVGGGSLGAVSALAADVVMPPAPAPSADEGSLTIRQLMERAAGAIRSAFPASVWVTGEVQNLSQKGGTLYLDLAEGRTDTHANATLTARAVIWSSALAALRLKRGPDAIAEVLQEGMQIRALCQVTLYKDRGSISLAIEDIDPTFTKGALALAREKLLKELRAKGLDQANRRLPLPPFPFRVGLVSAEGSRAKSDFLDQLKELRFPGEVVFCPAAMQGEGVPSQVVRALARLARMEVDLIVLTRGGGSAADLRWFDAPEVAYAIAGSPVPVIAAIGHHEDVCVAEEIAFLRQKTPTAAADFVASIFVKTREVIDAYANDLARTLANRVEGFALLTAALGERLAAAARQSADHRNTRLLAQANALLRGAEARFHGTGTRLAALGSELALTAERALNTRSSALQTLEGALARLDPRPWLALGWTQLTAVTGMVRAAAQAPVGALLKARLKDGWLGLRVETNEPRKGESP